MLHYYTEISVPSTKNTAIRQKGKSMSQKTVFISHSSRDEKIAKFLCNFLTHIGIHRDDIFCSSFPEHGVIQKISGEVRSALKSSIIDIIVLTPHYQRSDYCLNEAGAIWFKDDCLKLIVSQPDTSHKENIGFINGDLLFHDLSDNDFIETFFRLISDKIPKLRIYDHAGLDKQRRECLSSLPIIQNIVNNSAHNIDLTKTKQILKNCVATYASQCNNPLVFYQYYRRIITIDAADQEGYIKVTTGTQMTVVNMSDREHTETFNPQFLKNNGGKDSYKLSGVAKDKTILSDPVLVDNYNAAINTGQMGSYDYSKKLIMTVEPHQISDISLESTYEIPLEMFFQSKVIGYFCLNYTLYAYFTDRFKERFKGKYIFRYHISPPDAYKSTALTLKNSVINGDPNKEVVEIHFENGALPGTGYALAISKIISAIPK